MNRNIRTLQLLCIGVLVIALLSLVPQTRTRQSVVLVHMLDVGQGDSFLIEAQNGAQLLIDGGKDTAVLEKLAEVMPRGDRSIDIVLATHPDADHIGGLDAVFARYRIGTFITTQAITDTKEFQSLLRAVIDENIALYYARYGMVLTLDTSTTFPVSFTVLFPDRDTSGWETNTASIVGRLQAGERSMLFTGDSPISIEQMLRTTLPKEIDVDVLKLGHHGSRTSSSVAFLKATSPALALISAGADNRYGHPHEEVLSALQTLGIPWLSTASKGIVTLSTDGKTWTILK